MIVHKELKPTNLLGKVYLPGIFLLDYSFTTPVDSISEYSYLTYDEIKLNTIYYVYYIICTQMHPKMTIKNQLFWADWVEKEPHQLIKEKNHFKWFTNGRQILSCSTSPRPYLFNINEPRILKKHYVQRDDLGKRYYAAYKETN